MAVDGVAKGATSPRTDTPRRLVEAAEGLFADRGVEAVSLREINTASGARDVYALQYHFKDRSGLLRAVINKHMIGIEKRRNAMLDDYERRGVQDLGALVNALVEPLADKLHDPDGGRHFLRIYADVLNRPSPRIGVSVLKDQNNSLYRWRRLTEPMLSPEAIRFHRRFKAVLMTAVELARRAGGPERRDDTLFVSDLVDTVAAILLAAPSDRTRKLVKARAQDKDGEPALVDDFGDG